MTTQITANINVANQAIELVAPQDKNKNLAETEKISKIEAKAQEQLAVDKLSFLSLNQTKNISTEQVEEDERKAPELEQAIEIISDFMQLSTKNVNFQQDNSSDKTVIKVFDGESKELIKQFPSEEILDIAKKIIELRQDVGAKTGILLDEKV